MPEVISPLVALLPEDGSPITFDEWKAAAIGANLWSKFQNWHALKTSGQVDMKNVRLDPADPSSRVLQVKRPAPTP